MLLESLSDQVHIAEKACYAISQLAVCYKNRETSPMSTYCQEIIQALLNTVGSPTSSEHHWWKSLGCFAGPGSWGQATQEGLCSGASPDGGELSAGRLGRMGARASVGEGRLTSRGTRIDR